MGTSRITLRVMLLLFMVFALSGCWDNKDINHRVLPVVMGVGKAGDGYKVTLQLPQPVQGSSQFRIISQTGNTITKAVDSISLNMESSVDLLHLKVIIVDKKLAQEGMRDIISGFMRSRDVSPKTLLVVCDDDLDTFFDHVMNSKKPAGSSVLYDFFEKKAGWNPQIALTHNWEVYRSIHSYTRDVAMPLIKSGTDTLVQHAGSAIIKNGRMVGEISSEETLLFNAFNDQSTQGKIEVLDHASVLIVSDNMYHNARLVDGRPIMDSVLKLKVVVLETRVNPTPETIKDELEKVLTTRFNKMFSKLKTSKSDILGIGQYYRKMLSRAELKDWRTNYYANMELNLMIKIDIRNTGNLKSLTN